MTERLDFSEAALLDPADAQAIATCLVRVLGPALRGVPAMADLLARPWEPGAPLLIERGRCLDACAELLDSASRARRRGRELHAFALEGVEARLLDALIGSAGS